MMSLPQMRLLIFPEILMCLKKTALVPPPLDYLEISAAHCFHNLLVDLSPDTTLANSSGDLVGQFRDNFRYRDQ